MLDASYRMFSWSGDPAYITDPARLRFYDRTVTDYVARWGLGLDAIMKRPRIMNRKAADPDARFAQSRGIPGYNEETEGFVAGLDLLATQYAGFTAYARIQEARGDNAAARTWLARAAEVKAFVNRTWWDDQSNGFYAHLAADYRLARRGADSWNIAELYWPVADDGAHLRAALARLVDQIRRSPSAPIEEQSHHPEVLYRYGVADLAYSQIMDLSRPDRGRREYPEVPYAIVGAVVTGLMGVSVDPVTPGRESELLGVLRQPVRHDAAAAVASDRLGRVAAPARARERRDRPAHRAVGLGLHQQPWACNRLARGVPGPVRRAHRERRARQGHGPGAAAGP